jgi:hypothetical protein
MFERPVIARTYPFCALVGRRFTEKNGVTLKAPTPSTDENEGTADESKPAVDAGASAVGAPLASLAFELADASPNFVT